MLQIIRKGDKTTYGGSVLTASETMKFGAISPGKRPFSLAGDEPPWFKLPQHDGQSGGSAGHAGAL
ncbi:hypothetical protein STW0522CIT19_14370 [Citrobacter freundii]|nr:hypothetical protein STW0522CIT01_14370 [Citrobacter freundii]BBV34962.1 hypothetical protein STW0522CIT19_14370 [Citrobacter freundii]